MLREAFRTFDIELIDHVILGRRGCDPSNLRSFSFQVSPATSTEGAPPFFLPAWYTLHLPVQD
jgi:hypothetical protein